MQWPNWRPGMTLRDTSQAPGRREIRGAGYISIVGREVAPARGAKHLRGIFGKVRNTDAEGRDAKFRAFPCCPNALSPTNPRPTI